jgi:hypothetical protein
MRVLEQRATRSKNTSWLRREKGGSWEYLPHDPYDHAAVKMVEKASFTTEHIGGRLVNAEKSLGLQCLTDNNAELE